LKKNRNGGYIKCFTVKYRYSVVPKERIIPLNPTFLQELPFKFSQELVAALGSLKMFLQNHGFDPVAAFGYDPNACAVALPSSDNNDETDSIAEELKKINHPTDEPLQLIRQFESVLENFGPWCAGRSLILLLKMVDRLKV
jgi:hypothetical protein